MNQPAKTCPKCGSSDYTFRGRKKIEPVDGQEAAVETKSRCKPCGHEWKVMVGANGQIKVQLRGPQKRLPTGPNAARPRSKS